VSIPAFLHGALALHRRGKVLEEALSAAPIEVLPDGRAVVIAFAEGFQLAPLEEQTRLISWTRASGHLLLLVPPFATRPCERPVSWHVERMDAAPRGGEGIAKVLASEVSYRLAGNLQTPAVPGATWADLSINVGSYRVHPAAGLFAVTCLPLWSLSVLDAVQELEAWLGRLLELAGDLHVSARPEPTALRPEHYGFLIFLLSKVFDTEEQAFSHLLTSSIFRFSAERARLLLKDLRERGLVAGIAPTPAAHDLIMQSPYAHYVDAVCEVAQ
jgi:hypothetical protein